MGSLDSSFASSSTTSSLDVAIVGGGIIGVMTALGLLRRGLRVAIYERASDWHEIGAGFGFTGVARECMQRIDPAILDVLTRISEKASSSAHTRYWDGFTPQTKEDAALEAASLLWQMPEKDLSFWGCLRSHFLLGMTALLPPGVAHFGKQFVGYEDDSDGDKKSSRVVLHFADGSTAEADVLVGCDGIHSSVREQLLGANHPASHPSYTHTVAYRTMVPIDAAIAALGEDKARSGCMHCGPDVNMMSYPVMNGTLFNIAIFAHEDADFPDPVRMTAPGSRDEIERALQHWGPHMRDIATLFPDKLVKWGIFDMAINPAPTYARGRVCVAGDAAHASSPFQGVGACIGVEDALVLCEVLHTAATTAAATTDTAFSQTRIERSQWSVQSSREMGQMYQWRYAPTGRDVHKCKAKLTAASRRIWDFDVDQMVAEAKTRAGGVATTSTTGERKYAAAK
ncbi:hypothetical protein DV738_g1890, partial [Chaetothyriales sp. CBS 135597]